MWQLYIWDHSLFQGFGQEVVSLGLRMRFAELEFSVKLLRSSAGFGGRLQRSSPWLVRSEHRRDRGRMPSETMEKLQKYRMSRKQFRRFWLYLKVCSAWMIYKNWHHFQTVVATVLNFALAYSRAFVLLDVCRAWTNETCHRGAAQTPLTLPYSFRTWPGSGTWANREKLEEHIFFCTSSSIRPSYSWILA